MADAGLTAIAGELIDPHAEANAEVEQLGLFAPPATEAGQAKALAKGWSGIGRKPGARNKRTEATVAFILSRHRDPRVVLAEMAEANVYDLVAMLGCTLFEAYQEKRLAAIGVLPYVAARITPEVIDNRQVIHLHFGAGEISAEGGSQAGAVHVLDPAEFEHIERVEAFERAKHEQIERDTAEENSALSGVISTGSGQSHALSHK